MLKNYDILYISYDGLMEPLGQSQVLEYLKALAKDFQIAILSYEKQTDLQNKANYNKLKEEIESLNMHWVSLKYHKNPTLLATSYDIFLGIFFSLFLIFKHRIKIVHARSYVAAVIGLFFKVFLNKKFIFDMRGFWPEEKVDTGSWQASSLMFKATKYCEKAFLLHADTLVSLTSNAVKIMQEYDFLKNKDIHFEIIPTCVNLDNFKPSYISPKDEIVLGYSGSTGGWYVFEPVLEFFKILLIYKPSSKLIILTRDSKDNLLKAIETHSIPKDKVKIKSVDFKEIPSEIGKFDFGIFFIKNLYSKKASAPTKLGEFLACGVPCITNSGIGDMDKIIEKEGGGILLKDFSQDSIISAVKKVLKMHREQDMRDRCVCIAKNHFSLSIGVQSYSNIYKNFLRL